MVLRVLLAVQCCSCGYSIICPSYGLYGSISIYYKAGLCVSGCMRTYAYNLTLWNRSGTHFQVLISTGVSVDAWCEWYRYKSMISFQA